MTNRVIEASGEELRMAEDSFVTEKCFGKHAAYTMEMHQQVQAKMEDPLNRTGLPSAALMYLIIDLIGQQANMIQALQESIVRMEEQQRHFWDQNSEDIGLKK